MDCERVEVVDVATCGLMEIRDEITIKSREQSARIHGEGGVDGNKFPWGFLGVIAEGTGGLTANIRVVVNKTLADLDRSGYHVDYSILIKVESKSLGRPTKVIRGFFVSGVILPNGQHCVKDFFCLLDKIKRRELQASGQLFPAFHPKVRLIVPLSGLS